MNRRKGIRARKNGMKINADGQTEQMKEEIGELEGLDDTTKYGEFVSSYFAWLTPDMQKRKANEIEEMTEGKRDRKDD